MSEHNNDHNNWLGFSLTPNNAHITTTDSSSTYFLNNTSALCGFGVAGNSPFHHHSPLSVMPLKSDGSLCIMEALNTSHSHPPPPQGPMVSSSSPKLEDFLGGATMSMGGHNYQDREAMMALSLDSIYYPQTTSAKPHSQDYYSGIALYQTTSQLSADQIPQIGNWPVSAHYYDGGCAVSASGAEAPASLPSGDLQSLSLSMSPGSQSSCVTAPRQISPSGTVDRSPPLESKKRGPGKVALKTPVHRKSIDTFGQRTSQYRGVTRHRWTGRYEAHLWDNSCKKEGQTRKGRQVYLGGYDMEDKAARAYDLAALKYWGPSTHINFPLENYQTELEEMKNMSRQEYVAHLRRKSSGFSRGASMYRGVTRHHQHGRWQARIGRVAGNKDLYLGTFSTQEEAAEAYDVAAIKFRGVNAVTNFDITRYDVERIMASNTLLAGELARRNKDQIVNFSSNQSLVHSTSIGEANAQPESNNVSNNMNGSDNWKMSLYQDQQQQSNGCMESVEQKPISSFSMALHGLIGIDSVNISQPMMEDSGSGKAHFSDPSSLVTSLSSSREGSPDKSGPGMIFAKPPLASKFVSPSSWFPTSQLRSHFPVFAAWNDA